MTKDDTRVVLDNYEESFNDGKWHSIVLVLKPDFLELNVDNRPMQTIRKLDFMTGTNYFIAGLIIDNNFVFKCIHSILFKFIILGGIYGSAGFVGCMRLIIVDGNYMLPTDWKLGVSINVLQMYTQTIIYNYLIF